MSIITKNNNKPVIETQIPDYFATVAKENVEGKKVTSKICETKKSTPNDFYVNRLREQSEESVKRRQIEETATDDGDCREISIIEVGEDYDDAEEISAEIIEDSDNETGDDGTLDCDGCVDIHCKNKVIRKVFYFFYSAGSYFLFCSFYS